MGDFLEGGAAAVLKPLSSHSVSSAEKKPSEIGADNWATAERAAGDITRRIQPTSESEERRKKVVDYIRSLFWNRLGAEVFLYGSVPLKTFLPEGDIDLTTFGCLNVEDALADNMKSLLEEEERNASSVFVVKDVQLIRAEVKIVKFIVDDIVVDVSFNQIGGLSTLCFLEQVDHFIGEDHLFKRSIILIKAWCYYESRVLGSHHSLISTYALETMVLYIFHHFHSTLDGPLSVLYKFLCYFGVFDWETYCISLNGPVRRASLPAIAVETPEDSGKELLLTSEFLSWCIGMFSVSPRNPNKKSYGFQEKHLNIFDPLKEVNNLGRSVSKANFYRICGAFSYGARKLECILWNPVDSIANELHMFFPNTMARHGSRQNLDAPQLLLSILKPHQNLDSDESKDEDLSGDYASHFGSLDYGRWSYENCIGRVHRLPLQNHKGIVPHFKPNGVFYPRPPMFGNGLQPMIFPKTYIMNQPPQVYSYNYSYRPPTLTEGMSNSGRNIEQRSQSSQVRMLPESSYHLKDEADFPPFPV